MKISRTTNTTLHLNQAETKQLYHILREVGRGATTIVQSEEPDLTPEELRSFAKSLAAQLKTPLCPPKPCLH
jgi:hypothetical protein